MQAIGRWLKNAEDEKVRVCMRFITTKCVRDSDYAFMRVCVCIVNGVFVVCMYV